MSTPAEIVLASGGRLLIVSVLVSKLKQGISLATIGVVLTAVDEFLVSTGSTVIQAADTLLILADQDQFRQVADALTGRAAE